jgi:hypothetical protein
LEDTQRRLTTQTRHSLKIYDTRNDEIQAELNSDYEADNTDDEEMTAQESDQTDKAKTTHLVQPGGLQIT